MFQENLAGENYVLSRQKDELAENLNAAEVKLRKLQSEIDDLTESQTQATEVTALKRDKHGLQSKLKGKVLVLSLLRIQDLVAAYRVASPSGAAKLCQF